MQHSRRDFLKQTGRMTAALGAASMLESQGVWAAPQAPPSRMNILFFFPDQHRHDWLGTNRDLPVRTPNIDSLGRRGARFTSAVCPSPVCSPSRACLASGKEYDRCGVPGNGRNYPEEQTTFYTLLRQSGYHVMGCGKFDLRKPAASWGRDGQQIVNGKSYLDLWGFSAGIDSGGKHDGVREYKKGNACPYMTFLESRNLAQVHVDDFANRRNYDGRVTALPDDAYVDNWIAERGLDLIRRSPAGKPWFLQVNFNGPHEPMDVTQRMKDRWKEVGFPPPNRPQADFDHDGIRQNYAAMIENIDRWLGVYLDELQKRGELNRTLIVYSSDHGEMLGDHGMWAKSKPHQPSVGVPLVVAGPGVRQGWVTDAPTQTLDLAATFLDVGGVSTPQDMDCRSLLPLLVGKTETHRSLVRSGLGKWRMVWDGRYKLIRGYDPTVTRPTTQATTMPEPAPLLFDLHTDPLENVNIAERAPDVLKRLNAEL